MTDAHGESIAHLRRVLAPAAADGGEAQRFCVVPLSRRDAFLVPLDSRAAASRSLSAYSGMRTRPKRLVRRALAAAWAFGVPEMLLRTRATLPTGRGTLLDHLRGVLDEPQLTFATGLRRVGSFFTPVLQLFRTDGTPVAYAKIGWDAVTAVQVRAEADALALVRGADPVAFHAPYLVHAGEWNGLMLCVTAPLPARARQVPEALLPGIDALAELVHLDGDATAGRLTASSWWRAICDEAPGFDRQAPGFTDALERIEVAAADLELRFGRWHGDWVSWNMAHDPDTRPSGLFVWDWEYSRPGVPFGLDLLHFSFQAAFVQQGVPMLEAFDRAGRQAVPGLTALGIDLDAQAMLRVLHRLELRVRSERAVAAGAEPDPGVRDVPISTLFSRLPGTAGSAGPVE
jgi:hypothetical protein